MPKERHPADERPIDWLVHLVAPAVVGLAVLGLSLILDLRGSSLQLTQRAGSVITIVGAYFAYRESKTQIKAMGGGIYFDLGLPYKYFSLFFVLVGTVLWGYGDLLVNAAKGYPLLSN